MLHDYLVSYHHSKGLGTAVLTLNNPILRIEDIEKVTKFIAEEYEMRNVGLISYQLICTRES